MTTVPKRQVSYIPYPLNKFNIYFTNMKALMLHPDRCLMGVNGRKGSHYKIITRNLCPKKAATFAEWLFLEKASTFTLGS